MLKKLSLFILVCIFANYYLVSPHIYGAEKYKTGFQIISASKSMQGQIMSRLKVPGGWLVLVENWKGSTAMTSTVTFLPDPEYKWEVTSKFLDRLQKQEAKK